MLAKSFNGRTGTKNEAEKQREKGMRERERERQMKGGERERRRDTSLVDDVKKRAQLMPTVIVVMQPM